MGNHKHTVGDEGVMVRNGVRQSGDPVVISQLDRNTTYRVREPQFGTYFTLCEDEFFITRQADGTVVSGVDERIAAAAAAREARIEQLVQSSVAEFGIEHTHDFECRTWRGQNWLGACDCTLPERAPALVAA